MRFGTVVLVTLWTMQAAPGAADTVVINNGLAPPNPENVIDAGNSYPEDDVYVQNVGCDATLEHPCAAPGAPTSVELVEGGSADLLGSYDSSSVAMSGGSVNYLWAYDSASIVILGGEVLASAGGVGAYDLANITMSGGSLASGFTRGSSSFTLSGGSVIEFLAGDSSTVTMSGGSVGLSLTAMDFSSVAMSGGDVGFRGGAQDSASFTMSGGSVTSLLAVGSSTVTMTGGSAPLSLEAFGSSTLTLSGGSVGGFYDQTGYIAAYDSSTIKIIGTGFAVDGVPVDSGPIAAMSGTLTGTLASGDPIDNEFCHIGGESLRFPPLPGPFPATGQISLAPEPDAALLSTFALLGLLASRRC